MSPNPRVIYVQPPRKKRTYREATKLYFRHGKAVKPFLWALGFLPIAAIDDAVGFVPDDVDLPIVVILFITMVVGIHKYRDPNHHPQS